MTYSNNIKAYRNAFGTMEKIDQVIALYDTAIASLSQAKEAIERKDIEQRFNKVSKAYAIVSGLRDCIDYENGGEVAQTLKEWYTDTAMRIMSVNRTEDVSICDLCVNNLRDMRDAWAEAKEISNGEQLESESSSSVSSASPSTSGLGDGGISAMSLQGLAISV